MAVSPVEVGVASPVKEIVEDSNLFIKLRNKETFVDASRELRNYLARNCGFGPRITEAAEGVWGHFFSDPRLFESGRQDYKFVEESAIRQQQEVTDLLTAAFKKNCSDEFVEKVYKLHYLSLLFRSRNMPEDRNFRLWYNGVLAQAAIFSALLSSREYVCTALSPYMAREIDVRGGVDFYAKSVKEKKTVLVDAKSSAERCRLSDWEMDVLGNYTKVQRYHDLTEGTKRELTDDGRRRVVFATIYIHPRNFDKTLKFVHTREEKVAQLQGLLRLSDKARDGIIRQVQKV